jgi:hypothetical protein
MCSPLIDVYEFGKEVNKLVLSNRVKDIPGLVRKLEKTGYRVAYETFCLTVNDEKRQSSINDFMKKASRDHKGLAYAGVLIFTPGLNRKNYQAILLNDKNPFTMTYRHITDKAMEEHKGLCIVGHYYNSKEQGGKVRNSKIHVMCVYSQ